MFTNATISFAEVMLLPLYQMLVKKLILDLILKWSWKN